MIECFAQIPSLNYGQTGRPGGANRAAVCRRVELSIVRFTIDPLDFVFLRPRRISAYSKMAETCNGWHRLGEGTLAGH